jgi:hypothetical protein
MGDKAAGVSDDMINMLAGQQLVSRYKHNPVQGAGRALGVNGAGQHQPHPIKVVRHISLLTRRL